MTRARGLIRRQRRKLKAAGPESGTPSFSCEFFISSQRSPYAGTQILINVSRDRVISSEIRRLWFILHRNAPALQRLDLSLRDVRAHYMLFRKGIQMTVEHRGDFSAMEEWLNPLRRCWGASDAE